MQKQISIFKPVAFIFLYGLMIGCKTEQVVSENYMVEEDIHLDANQEFTYNLASGISIEGEFSIRTQAKNHETSEITINDGGTFAVQYVYKPSLGFIGDIVILENGISIGGDGCDKIELYKFSFHVK